MRVTQKMLADDAIKYISENFERLGELQATAASGKRFQRASDDPGAVRASLRLRSSLTSAASFLETAQGLQEWMSATESALGNMIDLLTQAVNKALEGVSDTNPEARPALAQEIDNLLNEAIDAGNSTHQGSYLFAGHKTDTRPFALVSGNSDSVAYSGDGGMILRSLSPDLTMTANLDGSATLSPAFAALIAARDALYSSDAGNIQVAVAGLQSALKGVSEARALIGARHRQVTNVAGRLEAAQTALKSLLSQREDADMAETLSSLAQQQTVLQAVLEVGQRTLTTLNLFDLLR